MEEKKGIFGGALGRMILPGIILQSVLIGGGYATGREIVEYGAKFGAMGWLSGLATFVGFALVAILSFELIRLYKVYDFKSFLKELIGPLYHVFDLVYLLFMVIIIAVMSSATGAVVEQADDRAELLVRCRRHYGDCRCAQLLRGKDYFLF